MSKEKYNEKTKTKSIVSPLQIQLREKQSQWDWH